MISSNKLNDSINLKNFEKEIQELLSSSLSFLDKELSKIRTNRAHPSLIEDIKVSLSNGQQISPIKNIALINIPDALTIVIQPFDASNINDIERALSQSDNNFNPKQEGKTIKIHLPSMSKERRAELIKMVSKKKEESLINARKIRQDSLNEIKKAEKDKNLSKDFSQRLQKLLQQCLDKTSDLAEIACKKKELAINE